MQTVKFWTFINNAPVKIKLRQGESLSHYSRHRTDEGYSAEAHVWTLDGDTVTRERIRRGRDCDGGYFHELESYFTPDTPKIQVDGVTYPIWQNGDYLIRDQYAEAAGY